MKTINRRYQVPTSLVMDCVVREAAAPSRLILLLHGYQQSGASIFRKCESALPADAAVLAPNAPFPIPRKSDDEYKLGFSWYFYDRSRDEYYIDPQVALEMLGGLIRQAGLEHLPLTIVGFSQGGYLSPFVAQTLSQTRQVIGIASEFLPDEMSRPIRFRMDAIHGDQDEVVGFEGARRSHESLVSEGVTGEFRLLSGIDHRITPEVQGALRELLLLG